MASANCMEQASKENLDARTWMRSESVDNPACNMIE